MSRATLELCVWVPRTPESRIGISKGQKYASETLFHTRSFRTHACESVRSQTKHKVKEIINA
jgi:hypothetical protein